MALELLLPQKTVVDQDSHHNTGFKDIMADQTVDTFIAEILDDIKNNRLKLPTLPEIATKVRKSVEDENASAATIAKTINLDPALSARMLQVANSPLYRANKKIESVQSAVARLGAKVVRSLAMSLVMQQLFDTKIPALKKRMVELWSHSTEVAAISRVLAKKFTKLDPEQALFAGLIHDIGAIPVIARADGYKVLTESAEMLDDAIERLHGPVGKMILTAWQFDPAIVAVASEHEKIDRNSDAIDYVDVVLVANLHTYVANNTRRHAKINWSDVPAFAKLGLDADASIKLMEETREEINEMKSVLGS